MRREFENSIVVARNNPSPERKVRKFGTVVVVGA